MARLARDSVAHFFPDTVTVLVDGVPVAPATERLLPAGARVAELSTSIVSKGAVIPPPASAEPYTFTWTFSPLVACDDAVFTASKSSSTRIQPLAAGDAMIVTLKVTNRFETIEISFDLRVPL